VGLVPSFHFASIRTIGIYIKKSDHPSDDRLFGNLLTYDLLSRGYEVSFLNNFLSDSVNRSWSGIATYNTLSDSLRAQRFSRSIDAFAIGESRIASSDFYLREIRSARGSLLIGQTPRVEASMAFLDAKTGELGFGGKFADTTKVLLADVAGFAIEQARYMFERGLTHMLSNFPLCSSELPRKSSEQIPVVLKVDETYRSRFPADWKDRIIRRMLYVNDIYYRAFGVEFVIKDIIEEPSNFSRSLEFELRKLHEHSETGPWITVGVTLNPKLARNWFDRSIVGLGSYPTTSAVITAEPSFPDLHEWNSLDEALTLAHELGHIFGMPHVYDVKSIMYPTSEHMSIEFDSLSSRIFKSNRHDFIRLSEAERVKKHLLMLDALFRSGYKRSCDLIQWATTDLELLWHISHPHSLFSVEMEDSTGGSPLIPEYVRDTCLAAGVQGAIDMRFHRWSKARADLMKAIEISPEFLEAHVLLLKLDALVGDKNSAIERLKRIRELAEEWTAGESAQH